MGTKFGLIFKINKSLRCSMELKEVCRRRGVESMCVTSDQILLGISYFVKANDGIGST